MVCTCTFLKTAGASVIISKVGESISNAGDSVAKAGDSFVIAGDRIGDMSNEWKATAILLNDKLPALMNKSCFQSFFILAV